MTYESPHFSKICTARASSHAGQGPPIANAALVLRARRGARIPQVWGHVASSPYKRESSVERQFRGDFTLHDVRPSDRNTYITLYRARGHASSTDNTTTSSSATIRNDGKPHHHITIEHPPRTRRKLPAASSYDDWHGDDARTSREGGGTTSTTGITSSIGSPNKQLGRPRAPR